MISPSNCNLQRLRHEFLLNYQKDAHVLHVFYEGPSDESFYGHIIRHAIGGSTCFFTYHANGKKWVLEIADFVVKKINADGASDKTMYFVDKDIDNLFPRVPLPPEIHETELYSIENYLVSPDVLEIFLVEILKLKAGSQIVNELKTIFNVNLIRYRQFALQLMNWIIWHRRNGNRPNLNNISGNCLYRTTSTGFTFFRLSSRMATILDRQLGVQTIYQAFLRDRRSITNILKAHLPQQVIRGKYELQFFVDFLRFTIEYLKNQKQMKVKCHHTLSSDSVIEIFGPRLIISGRTRSYIAQRLN